LQRYAGSSNGENPPKRVLIALGHAQGSLERHEMSRRLKEMGYYGPELRPELTLIQGGDPPDSPLAPTVPNGH
jgi:hypothetical protein